MNCDGSTRQEGIVCAWLLSGTVRAALTGQLWDTTADAAVAGNLLFAIFLSSEMAVLSVT